MTAADVIMLILLSCVVLFNSAIFLSVVCIMGKIVWDFLNDR